jgi:hypothetical protein
MKFSTIRKIGDAYQVFAGATFPLAPVEVDQLASIYAREAWLKTQRLRDSSGVDLSNELLLSSDVQLHETTNSGKLITILKAALRMGDSSLLVPESEAARCEEQYQAHAVWIPDPRKGSDPFAAELLHLAPGNTKMSARQILMPGLAVLTQDDVLEVKLVHYKQPQVVWVNTPPATETSVGSFTVTFDGTNIKLDGVDVELLPQTCYV